jgi:hypothetical protein
MIALAIFGIAVTVVLQLFSANLRAISASEDYVSAAAKAEAKMREILENEKLSERTWSETTSDGGRIDVSINEVFKDRTSSLQVRMLEINLAVHWIKGTKKKSLTLTTMKVLNKQV